MVFLKYSKYRFDKQPHTYKILILGNHEAHNNPKIETDSVIFQKYLLNFQNLTHHNIFLLQDEAVVIEGYKIYGSSWQVQWTGTGFYKKRGSEEIKKIWNSIPQDTEILVTHSPSFGPLLDQDLKNRVLEIKPKVHIFGHVHEGNHGVIYEKHPTSFIKACVVDDNYQISNDPFVFYLSKKET